MDSQRTFPPCIPTAPWDSCPGSRLGSGREWHSGWRRGRMEDSLLPVRNSRLFSLRAVKSEGLTLLIWLYTTFLCHKKTPHLKSYFPFPSDKQMLPDGKHCAPPGFTSCVFALTALQILQRCPISWKISKSGSSIMLPFGENQTTNLQRWESPFKIQCSVPPVDSLRCMWRRCDHHHISNHVVVPAFGSVHSQDPKHKENHGSGVDQRTHRRLAAHTAAARIEAKRFGWFRFGSRWGIFENRSKENPFNHVYLYGAKISA